MAELRKTDRGPVRVLTLDRPEVKNALSRTLRTELHAAVVEAGADDAVRAVVITGAGDAFCAGLDLRELEGTVSLTPAEHREDTTALAELFLAIVASPKPVVAAVNGPAVAGGAGIVTACDVAFAAPEARFGYTEARIGFVAALVSVLLLRQVGEKHARELLLGGHLIDAERAAAMGLVNQVVTDGTVVEAASRFAERLARNAPGSLAATKRLLADLPGSSLRDGMAAAVEVNVASRSGEELKEGVRAFLEKREAAWRA
ncbi:MAG TPA: enoyl-CoA hydratase-related protein [Trueperaceae bacterium]|nr:enoyl-CoA hydratase-related protein [Trueperaceae bacterium]